ncbi:MAG TPA: TonB-dependent receptor [Polyangiaceae bacterium]|nr:TonB-dependent receptor [Polyangiaceae bacterium]
MRRVGSLHTVLLVLQLLPLLAATAQAEQGTTPNADTAQELVLPQLLRFIEASWPSDEPPRPSISVLLDVTIDEQGRVTKAVVLESAGNRFDAEAISAVERFEFAPALKGSQPVPARIRYRYAFSEPKPSAPANDAATDVAAPSSDAPAEPKETGSPRSAPTPPQGLVAPNPPATEADAPEPVEDESYTAVAEIAAPPREVTRHTIDQQDLMKIPGTSGDALRAIEVMPGVGRTSINSGDPILRGAAWNESRSYIEGSTVPLLYHFGGVKSAFNSRLLTRVDLYPGNYGASFGRGTGGVVSAKIRDPMRDRFHALAEASVIDSMALIETPIGPDAAVAFAARRSNIGFFYDAFAPKSSFSVAAVPTYYDYQALGWVRLHPRHQLRVMAYGSRDSLHLVFANPADFDPGMRDQVDFAVGYHRVQAALDSELSPRLTQHVQLTYGYTTMRQMLGANRAEMGEHDFMSRGEWNLRTSDRVRVNVGYDLELLTISGYYIGNRPPQAEGEVMNGSMSTEAVVDLSDLDRIKAVRPGAYAEIEWRPLVPLLVVPGVRVDYYSDQGAWTVDPRLSVRYDISERFSAKWGLGIYSQNPMYYELLRGIGNPKLKPYHAQQYSVGIEHRPSAALTWGLEGFYKQLYDRVVSTPGGQAPYFSNHGIGRIYGGELFARYTGERLRGWLAYTLSRSERQDRGEPWRLFEADQTHILALTATVPLGRGWEIGGRFRLTSGNPYTPISSAVYDANTGVYQPVNARPFSARNPMFQQLDLRVEKLWQFKHWNLATYLDVQNAYNAKNYQGFDYSYDYQKREPIAGLSLVPNLGVRGEL